MQLHCFSVQCVTVAKDCLFTAVTQQVFHCFFFSPSYFCLNVTSAGSEQAGSELEANNPKLSSGILIIESLIHRILGPTQATLGK